MKDWTPDLERRSGPRYLAIAEAIDDAIAKGEFRPGDRLPTHRALARRLGLPVGTVSRAYVEAERRGLIQGEVGRGTFVRDYDEGTLGPPRASGAPGASDLSSNYPTALPGNEDAREMALALADLSSSPLLGRLLEYSDAGGAMHHRAAGAEWLHRCGLDVEPERVLVTSAAHHALTITLAALAQPGDTILTESLTYPALKTIAGLLHLRVEGVALDRDGLVPEALDEACARLRPRALYTVPTIHNPTCSVMPVERRKRIAEIVEARDLVVLEDEVHGRLQDPPLPPLASFVPQRACFIASMSKCLAPGLRIAYLVVPPESRERLTTALWASTWMAVPIMAEIASRWIRDGAAERILEARRGESARRQAMAAELLEEFEFAAHPNGFHLWLRLPAPWRAEEFVLEARQRGVLLSPTSSFAVERSAAPDAVRICLGALRDHEVLSRALSALAEMLRNPPGTSCHRVP